MSADGSGDDGGLENGVLESRLLVGSGGESKISMEDYAIAMVDELETPRHSRQRADVLGDAQRQRRGW